MDRLKKLLKKHEGVRHKVYDDPKGIPTIGAGYNLNRPDARQKLETMGLSYDDVIGGKQELTDEQVTQLLDDTINEKQEMISNIQKQDFPNAELDPGKLMSLTSLMYNSPKLLGPRLRRTLDQNNDLSVAREILFYSNKNKIPGITKRRLDEAALYLGPRMPKFVESLSESEKDDLRNSINQIENEFERAKVFEQYPFLKN